MLKAVFFRKDGCLNGFRISGHAGYGTEGNDIVCAAVSSAVMFVINTATDFFDVKAEVSVEENRITFVMEKKSESGVKLLESFYAHMQIIAEEHSKVKLETKQQEEIIDD